MRSLLERRFHPWGQHLLGLLTASPPVLFPEGMLYQFDLEPVTRPDPTQELEVRWDKART